MEKPEVTKTHSRIAHANFKKGLRDYNDGENVTHHLGNDDYKNRNNLDEYEDNEKFDGTVASGNELLDDDLEDA
jgi:hypothetical protein